MSDNVRLNVGIDGDTVALEDIAGVKYQKIKLIDATAASTTPVGTATNPLRFDPTGTSTQPVSGTVTANAGTGTLTVSGPLTDTQLRATAVPVSGTVTANAGTGTLAVSLATLPALVAGSASVGTVVLTAETTKVIGTVNLAAAQTLATVTNLAQQGGVAISLNSGVRDTGTQRVTIATNDVVPVTDNAGALTVDWAGTAPPIGAGVEATALRVTVATDSTGVLAVKQATAANLNTAAVGTKTNNNAAPGATNVGALIAIANDALPAYTEGNLGIPACDLRGVLRSVGIPMAALGFYRVKGRTATYSGLSASAPLFSMRWGDATRFGIVIRFRIFVVTTVTATTAGLTERELIIARAFTASDTGGTAITLTGNNQKMRTSHGTSLMTDMRSGGPLTAGTRTLDANPIASAAGWSPLTTVGIAIGSAGAVHGTTPVTLYDISRDDFPIVFATNEGLVLRLGPDAQPAGATQQTYFMVDWAEANKVY